MSVIMFISHFWLYHLITMFSLVNWQLNIGLLQFFWPVRTSPARCGRSGGSGWVWLCNQSVRSSYRLRLQADAAAAAAAAADPPPFSGPDTPSASSMLSNRISWASGSSSSWAPRILNTGTNKQEVIPTARYPRMHRVTAAEAWIHWPCVPMCIISTLYALNSIENY